MLSQSEMRKTKKWDFTESHQSRKGQPPRSPCRTLSELAEIFGVTASSLKAFMQHYPGHPASTSGTRIKYYPLHAMVKWWNETILPKRVLSQS